MIFKIAFRNIFRQKRRTILTMLSMIGGFALASFAIGFQDGAYVNVIDIFTRSRMGHLQVHKEDFLSQPSIYKTIDDYENLMEEIKDKADVESLIPRVLVSGLASFGDKTAGVSIIGMDPHLEDTATQFNNTVTVGEPLSQTPNMSVMLGQDLAKNLKAELGDTIIIISQAADGSMANELFTVCGLVDSGDENVNKISFYIHIKDAQDMFVLPHKVHEIAIILPKIGPERKVAAALSEEYKEKKLNFMPWQEVSEAFYRSMEADKKGGYVAYFMILTIVAVGVLNTVLMTVLERTKEYGVLKALGTRPADIIKLVLIEVNIMAILSILIGSVFSTIGIAYLVKYGVDMGTTYDIGGITMQTMYGKFLPIAYYWPAMMVIIMSTLAGILPAIRAAHVQPAKALRN